MGIWGASFNNTYRAIDMIPKDVVICDWHYRRPDPTAALFAAKGFRVLTCPWQMADVAVKQDKMMRSFIDGATEEMKPRYLGMLQTIWCSAKKFMDSYNETIEEEKRDKSAACFRALSEAWK